MSNPYTYYGESGAEYFVCRCETLYCKKSHYGIAASYPKKNKKILINEVEYQTAEEAQAALDEMASKKRMEERNMTTQDVYIKGEEFGQQLMTLREIERTRASMTLQEAEEEAYLQNSLLPCPFCGGRAEASITHRPGSYYYGCVTSIICTKCRKTFYFGDFLLPDDARDKWNRRAAFETPLRQVAVSGGSKAASHYQLLSQQPIEIMQTLFSADEFRGFLWGNVIKYALRYGHKDERRKEAEKIAQYAEWLARAERGEAIKP